MVKLAKKDKVYLQSIGYLKTDFTQIKGANYKYYAEGNQKISEEEAIKKLGRECWLSGIGGACFHASSVRNCKCGSEIIYITSDTFDK